MHFQVHPSDELPIYKQIIRQVLDGIAAGHLAPGEKLPSQRELAQKLVVAPLTVKKGYEQLERDGAIETRRGQGTFVSATPPVASPEQRRERLRSDVRRLLTDAWASGMPLAELIELLAEEHEARLQHENEQPEERP